MLTHSLGFPRVGLKRELKAALEAFWTGKKTKFELLEAGRALRLRHWDLQREQGVDLIPVGDFSFYDHVLDTTAMLGAVPARFGWKGGRLNLGAYFRMARGEGTCAALELSKWFDTNYHYLVPELREDQVFKLSATHLLEQVAEANAAGIRAKPVLLGPLTWLKSGKAVVEGFDPLGLVERMLPIYEEVLRELSRSVEWIQIDEPILVLDLTEREKTAFRGAYARLVKAAGASKIMLATYFGALGDNTALAVSLGTAALHIDLARAPWQLGEVLKSLGPGQCLSLGVVDGRNVWRTDPDAALGLIREAVVALGAERVLVAPSCSLLHVPQDLDAEAGLDADIRGWLAFAKQKCAELRVLADSVEGDDTRDALEKMRAAAVSRRNHPKVVNPAVRRRLGAVDADMSRRATPYEHRKTLQQARLALPLLPTTTIGSFPQTAKIRETRSDFKNGRLDRAAYTRAIQAHIKEAVDRQHELGLDVLVHGEPERNDMVEYFGEQLEGFCFTQNGWVQSYGSRCVKPPVVFGDVSRPKPMTIEWTQYAQSLTAKPMKGMLTGPVTILMWSFVRDDQPRSETCRQIALAIRDEIRDLERAGVPIIQVDEAALREGLPLRRADRDAYLRWAVGSFKLATGGVRDETQIHTHMCYSEFNDIVAWIAKMDADVVSIEASRSGMELLKAFRSFDYPNDIGPGIYDIHSPRVPDVDEMTGLLREALQVIPAERLWVNPDCGLKTRAWSETLASLANMVAAAKNVREEVRGPA